MGGGGAGGEESFLIQAVPRSNITISIDNQENAHLQLKKICHSMTNILEFFLLQAGTSHNSWGPHPR